MSKHYPYNYKKTDKPITPQPVEMEVEEAVTAPEMETEEIIETPEVVDAVEAPCEEVVEVEELLQEETSVDDSQTETLIGKVSGCKQLNVRKEPSKESEIVSVISEGAILMIDSEKSVEEWFKVYTEAGIEGFCMSKFVTIM